MDIVQYTQGTLISIALVFCVLACEHSSVPCTSHMTSRFQIGVPTFSLGGGPEHLNFRSRQFDGKILRIVCDSLLFFLVPFVHGGHFNAIVVKASIIGSFPAFDRSPSAVLCCLLATHPIPIHQDRSDSVNTRPVSRPSTMHHSRSVWRTNVHFVKYLLVEFRNLQRTWATGFPNPNFQTHLMCGPRAGQCGAISSELHQGVDERLLRSAELLLLPPTYSLRL